MIDNDQSDSLLYQIIIFILSLMLLIWFLFYYTGPLHRTSKYEHMVNIKKPDKDITWTTDETCPYEMTKVYTDILNEYGIKHDKKDWLLYFPCTYNDSDKEIDKVKPINSEQRIFIITNTNEISSKSDLWLNLVKKYGPVKASTLAPKTYVLYDDADIKLFEKEYDPNKIYIMKKNIQRQEGIKITDNKEEIINGYKNNNFVVAQELLSDPYLIRGRKTNMRFYLLLVCQKGEVSSYVHNDGFMYYTKVSFVKGSKDFATNVTTGYIERWIYKVNPLTHDDFRKYLDDPETDRVLLDKEIDLIKNKNKISDVVFKRIYELLEQVVKAVERTVCKGTHLENNITFQLFGVDIAVSDTLEPKIIEINIGPNLGTHDGRDSEIKHKVVRDIFKVLKITPKSEKEDNGGFIQLT
ncbi:MAG: tubulin-tyrosine ligase family protein [Barrevirus sp.]|uniref:Tubulin-tyrosine ligase family protein n=1 Tax=Barrevirus sp. TaxID=2487763 RepID=A0A3G4ZTD8_9VIRU|nr:MAG: tubulin-tyrosine ligase family protein [Barrevirus sp.]